jgi:EmrB/QacA subfamily drug resistance transporter
MVVPETTTGPAPAVRPEASAAPAPLSPRAAGRAWLLAALLGATVLGTISNNIVNVPLRQITADFGVPVTQGVLIASASVLVLAVAMPLTGWVSDRLGRRRTLVLALSVLLLGTVGATLAPSLTPMVISRALQGLGCAAVPVAVMGTLARTFPPERRNSVMGAWGAANGIGQAIGPPVGGFIADAFGWRAIFGALIPVTIGVLVLTLRVVPRDSGQQARIDWAGAGSLTVGVALLMTAVTAAPQPGVPPWVPAVGAALGLAALVVFVLTGLRRAHPFIDPRLLVEIRWLRSATGVFVQQCTLAAVLVGVPLYLTGVADLSVSATGLLIFSLPLVWAVLAPLVGLLADRVGPRPVLRTGLGVLLAVDVGLAIVLGNEVQRLVPILALLVAAGAGVALVQTPALTGATRSPAGQRGAGLGLFNMMRFVGAAVGTAAVAAAWPDALAWLFGGCAAVAVGGLVLSFLGREVADAPSPLPVRAG